MWHLPASVLFGIGRKTAARLEEYGVSTVGDLANCSKEWLRAVFGVCGNDMWLSANGLNNDRVSPDSYKAKPKSIGHGVTCKADLENNEEVWKVFLFLSQNVAKRLIEENLFATGVQIGVRDTRLTTKQFQSQLDYSTQSAYEIAKTAIRLFKAN